MKDRNGTNGTKYILAIEGGGTRGAFPAHVLELLESRFGITASAQFDLIAGTSTGAIVGGAIAHGRRAEEIRSWYEEKERKIFGNRQIAGLFKRWWIPWCAYNDAELNNALQSEFGETKLGEVEQKLMILATNIRTGSVHVLKSGYDKEFKRDKDVLLWEAIRGSCGAPMYFKPFQSASLGHGVVLTDGGVWGNNPSLAAVIEGTYRLGWRTEDIRVLSLGTGQERVLYDVRHERQQWRPRGWGWGLAGKWQGSKLLRLAFALQGETAQNMVSLLLGEAPRPGQGTKVIRIDWETDKNLSPDETGGGENHAARAQHAVTFRSKDIEKFFEGE